MVNVHYSPCYWCSLTDQSERPVGELRPFGWIKLKQWGWDFRFYHTQVLTLLQRRPRSQVLTKKEILAAQKGNNLIRDPLGCRRPQPESCSNCPHSKVGTNLVWEGRDLAYFNLFLHELLADMAETIALSVRNLDVSSKAAWQLTTRMTKSRYNLWWYIMMTEGSSRE